jgi:ribonuclease VapC
MVLDSSALLAILQDEPERHHFNELVATAPSRLASSGTYLETGLVIQSRYGSQGLVSLKLYITSAAIDIIPFDREQAEIAAAAYATFGKGFHSAGLNFGDCMSYALSKKTGEPLLFKGDDFARTDVRSATHG